MYTTVAKTDKPTDWKALWISFGDDAFSKKYDSHGSDFSFNRSSWRGQCGESVKEPSSPETGGSIIKPILTSYLVSCDTLHTSCALFCFCHWEENSRKVDSFGRGYAVFRSLYARELTGKK